MAAPGCKDWNMVSIVKGSRWRRVEGGHTLGKDEIVLLDKSLESGLGELVDIGSTNNSRKESGTDGRVLHGGCKIKVN